MRVTALRHGRPGWRQPFNMAEFGIASDSGGHTWNNALAHATYEENVEKHGVQVAQEYLRKDIRSFIQEQKGQDSEWSLSLRGGQMVTETGVSLEEMTANITQGRYASLVPENIKATAHLEAATLREATRLAVEGAEKIILPEQHLDTDGNIVSRYLSVWTKNASDPTRYDGSRIDLGKNVRIEDVRTGTSFTAFEQQNTIAFRQDPNHKQAFALAIHTNTSNSFAEIKNEIVIKIHRSHQETYSRPLDSVPRQRQQTQTIPQESHRVGTLTDVSSSVFRDSRETARTVAIYLRNKKTQHEVHADGGVKRDAAIARNSERTSQRLTVATIREAPVRVGELVVKRHGQMRIDARAIGVIAETGVAIHAAPILLARLSEKVPAPIKALEKSLRRHERKVRKVPHFAKATRGRREAPSFANATEGRREAGEIRIEVKRKKEKGKKGFQKVQLLRSEGIEPLRKTKESKRRLKRRHEKGDKRVAVAETLTPIASERKDRQAGRRLRRAMRRAERIIERRPLPKQEKKLWAALVLAAAEFKPSVLPHESPSQNKKVERELKNPGFQRAKPGLVERTYSDERAIASGVRFALIVWMMVNHAHIPPVESKLATFISTKDGRKRRGAKLVHPKGEEKESTPWVLLSIIYYLTALREQGMVNTTNVTNTTNQQNKTTQRTLPHYAVIFAYAS